MSLVSQKAPGFTSAAVLKNGQIVSDFSLEQANKDKYVLIVFYPLDFTFVCPSELIALDRRMEDFESRNVEVMAISIDSQFSHHAWREMPIEKGGIGAVRYTLIADVNHSICKAYGVEHPAAAVALRGTFLIDKQGVVRSEIVNDLPLGRDIDEMIRLVDALQHHEQHGEVCPAGWNKGKPAMKATKDGVATYLTENAEAL